MRNYWNTPKHPNAMTPRQKMHQAAERLQMAIGGAITTAAAIAAYVIIEILK